MNYSINITNFFGVKVSSAIPNYTLAKLSLAVVQRLYNLVARLIGFSLRPIGTLIVSHK